MPLSKIIYPGHFYVGLTAAASAADTGLLKKIFGSATYGSETTALIISNKEIKQILKIVKLLEDCGLLIKGVTQTIENKTKEKRVRFLNMFLCIS